MAVFDNQAKKTPLGVELIRRGLVKDSDINEAIKLQKKFTLFIKHIQA